MAWTLERQVPRANTEGTNTASVIGCTYYVVVGIIWSIIWYVGLDPIKWMMAYILNEDGFRDRKVRARPNACRVQEYVSAALIRVRLHPSAEPVLQLHTHAAALRGRTQRMEAY